MAFFANRFSRIREAGKPITLRKFHGGVATVAPHIVPYQLGVRCALAVDEAMEPLQLAAMSVRAIVVPAVVLYFHAEYHHIFSMDVQPRC